MSVVTTWRSDLYHLLAMCLVYVRIIVSSRYQCVCYFIFGNFNVRRHTSTLALFCARESKTFSWLIFVLSCLFSFIIVLLWFQFSLTYLTSLHAFIVHIGALLLLFLHAVVNVKIIYGAQYKMYSCWYNSVCSPNSVCLLGLYFFLSNLFWKSLWGVWSSVGCEYEDCSLLGCKTMKFF